MGDLYSDSCVKRMRCKVIVCKLLILCNMAVQFQSVTFDVGFKYLSRLVLSVTRNH